MALTAADIYTEVNARTGRTGNHATELKAILHDLAIQGVKLLGETEQDLTSGDRNYAVPSNTKKIRSITIRNSSTIDLDPMDEITYREYKKRVEPASDNGQPEVYAVENGVIYLDPPPNATTFPDMMILTELYHADSTTISWADRFREALIEGTVWKTLLGLDLGSSLGAVHGASYGDEVKKLLAAQSAEVRRITKYHDV